MEAKIQQSDDWPSFVFPSGLASILDLLIRVNAITLEALQKCTIRANRIGIEKNGKLFG